jgi:hypothetical protein
MDDKLDRILDEGIAGYANSEPLAGMEERILARIQVAERPQRRLMGWAAAFAVGLIAIAVLRVMPRHEEPQPVRMVANIPQAPARSQAATVLLSTRQRHHSARRMALPKLPVFPTPSPLTTEERRLLALVRKDPEGTAEAFESLRKRNEPLEIPPLVIAPLESGGGQ